MILMKLCHVWFLLVFHVCHCQRRIQDGETVNANKPYAVYLLKASVSTQYYDGWMCGGALVTTQFIVTSAACVTDVIHLFAIAGYKKYIKDVDINKDPCTAQKKKKIVLICTPQAYELRYEELDKWSYIDIAVVKVESPYDLNDHSFNAICSYIPETIAVNNEPKYQEPGIDALVFGWGHRKKWRERGDSRDYNQESLDFAPMLLGSKEECKKEYEIYPGMSKVIDEYMICSYESGNIDADGEMIELTPPSELIQGCSARRSHKDYNGIICENEIGGQEVLFVDSNNYRRTDKNVSNYFVIDKIDSDLVDINTTHNDQFNIVTTKLIKSTGESVYRRLATRRHGICQNDHGGPIVTWVGSHEVLIGVASVFKITDTLDCRGPYLFTSTQCNGLFLDCILTSETDPSRRAICDAPAKEKGFELITKHVSWVNHPAGPADNERNTTTNTSEKSTTADRFDTTTTSATDTKPTNLNNIRTLNLVNNTTTFTTNNTTPSTPIPPNTSTTTINNTTIANQPSTPTPSNASTTIVNNVTIANESNNAIFDVINSSAMFRTNITDTTQIKISTPTNTSSRHPTSTSVTSPTMFTTKNENNNTIINIVQNIR